MQASLPLFVVLIAKLSFVLTEDRDFVSKIRDNLVKCIAEISSRYFDQENKIVVSLPSKDVNIESFYICEDLIRTSDERDKNGSVTMESIMTTETCLAKKNRSKNFRVLSSDGINFSADITLELVTTLQKQEEWPILVCSAVEKRKFDRFNDNSYIFIIPVEDTITNVIEVSEERIKALKNSRSWNPRGRFIITLAGRLDESFRNLPRRVLGLFWKYKIINILLIIQDSDSMFKMYTWFPYQKPIICTHVKEVLINTWIFQNGGKFSSNSSLFPNKIGNDLKKCTLKVSALEIQPFTSLYNSSSGLQAGDLEGRLFNLIAKALNFSFVLVPPDKEAWGEKLPNNTWTGLKGDLFNNVTEVGFGGLLLDTELCQVFECTLPYLKDRLVWHVPRPLQIPQWQGIYRVFPTYIWIVVLITCLTVALLMWLLGVAEKEISFGHLDQSFSHMWAVMLAVSVPYLPNAPKLRILFLIWIIYCLHINIFYLSFLTSFLVNPGFEHQVSRVEELIISRLQYGYHDGFDKYFNDPTDSVMTTILRNRKHCDGDGTECLLRMVSKRDFSILVSATLVEYKNSREFFDSEGKPLYQHFSESFLVYDFVMYLSKYSPLLDSFNNVIRKVDEAGLIGQWWEEMKYAIRLSRVSRSFQEGSSTLALTNLISLYMFFAIGLGFSLCLFILEILWCPFIKKIMN